MKEIIYEREPHPSDRVMICQVHGLYYWTDKGCVMCRHSKGATVHND